MTRSTALAALVVATLAAWVPAQAQYQPRGFLRTGYSDRQITPDLWEVRASSHEEGGSVPVALYHAAELATSAGVAELRVVKQKVTTERMVRQRDGSTVGLTEKTQLTVRAIRTEADRMACDMPEARRCLTLPVTGIMSAYGPQLAMPAARPGEAPAAPVMLVSSRLGEPFPAMWQGGRTSPFMDALLGALRRRPAIEGTPVAPTPGFAPHVANAAAAPALGRNPAVTAPVAPTMAHTGTPAVAPPAAASIKSAAPLVEQASFTPAPRASTAAAVPSRRPIPRSQAAAEPATYEDLLRAAQPVSSDPHQGWTASE